MSTQVGQTPLPERDASPAGLLQRALLVLVVVVGAFVIFRLRGYRPESFLALVAVAALPVLLVAAVRRSWSQSALWAAYMFASVSFAYLRAMADGVGFPVRTDYVIQLDRLLFLGQIPTVWLQERLYTLGSPHWFDWSMLLVHTSYFLVPHTVALFIWAYRPRELPQYMVASIATYYVALICQTLIPTTPPWLAGAEGALPRVYRVVYDVLFHMNPTVYETGLKVVGENDVAAMPSLHAAITVIVALGLWRMNRVAGWFGAAYACLMVLALVYLGEHYVVDGIAGAALAVVVWVGVERGLIGWRASRKQPIERVTDAPGGSKRLGTAPASVGQDAG